MIGSIGQPDNIPHGQPNLADEAVCCNGTNHEEDMGGILKLLQSIVL